MSGQKWGDPQSVVHHSGGVGCVSVLEASGRLLTGGTDGRVVVWNAGERSGDSIDFLFEM